MREVRAAVLCAGQRKRPHEVDHVVGLTAEWEGAECAARQAGMRLSIEDAIARRVLSVVQIEAIFQIEYGLQPAAQVFRAAQSPTAVLDRTALQLPIAVPCA